MSKGEEGGKAMDFDYANCQSHNADFSSIQHNKRLFLAYGTAQVHGVTWLHAAIQGS